MTRRSTVRDEPHARARRCNEDGRSTRDVRMRFVGAGVTMWLRRGRHCSRAVLVAGVAWSCFAVESAPKKTLMAVASMSMSCFRVLPRQYGSEILEMTL